MRKVAETQRRGAAGMGGRTMEHTNAWDPSENSVAQTTWESQAPDVFKFYRVPPAKLRFMDKRSAARSSSSSTPAPTTSTSTRSRPSAPS
jgi:hypothetical protein